MTTIKTYLHTSMNFGNRKMDFFRGQLTKSQDVEKYKRKSSILSQEKPPETEEDYLESYQDRILNAQKRQLFPLQEDLAEWLNKTLGIDNITGDNFMDALDNGVILCQLARAIRERAQRLVDNGLLNEPVPELNGHCFQNAARRSFFSRDNMENFIVFCKELGVHQNLLFESDDLVLHNQPRNVILCLLELSRITTKFNIEPPGLIELEKEIAEEEQRGEEYCKERKNSISSWQFRPSFHSLSRSTSEGSNMGETMWSKPLEGSDGVPSDHTEDDWSRESADETDTEMMNRSLVREVTSPINELDRKVQQTTNIVQKHCSCNSPKKCSKVSVKKIGDGKYNIAGRNVFVRLLKGRHMMVRVGGGWDTLEHYLLRHDPCQVRIMNRGTSPSTVNQSKCNIYSSASLGSFNNMKILAQVPAAGDANTFLHIRAKYRSPPPP